jgi:hypothetical protein
MKGAKAFPSMLLVPGDNADCAATAYGVSGAARECHVRIGAHGVVAETAGQMGPFRELLPQASIHRRDHQPGAQTERRGLTGPVRDLLGGETSPADFLLEGDLNHRGHREQIELEFVVSMHSVPR